MAFVVVFVVTFFEAVGIMAQNGAGYQDGGKRWEREGNKEGEGWPISEFIATCRDHVIPSQDIPKRTIDLP